MTLCDAALEVNGRLHVLGSIDYFWANALPYLHPRCVLAARLRWDGHERPKKHKLRVQIIDADAEPLGNEFTCKFPMPMPEADDIPAVRHVIVDLQSLQFPSYGPYAARIEVDGAELASLPFSVVSPSRLPQRRTA